MEAGVYAGYRWCRLRSSAKGRYNYADFRDQDWMQGFVNYFFTFRSSLAISFLSRNSRLFGLFLVVSAWASPLVLHEKRDVPLPDSALLERRHIEKHVVLPMRIGLKQNSRAEANAEKWVMVRTTKTALRYNIKLLCNILGRVGYRIA